MAFPVPPSLSPSKVASFTDCALAFRFSAIDRLPDPPTVATTRGTLVHAALERLHLLGPAERTLEAALGCLDEAAATLRDHPDYLDLALSDEGAATFHAEAEDLVRNYFRLEDPTTIRTIGLELKVEADIDGVRMRGIIDRLELDAGGDLVVTDYKTGAAPATRHERKRLSGVHIYSLLCEQIVGVRPGTVQLLYLKAPLAITTTPTDQSTRGTRRTLGAIWQAVERACEREDFRPQPSRLCEHCAFQAYCPTFGGDPDEARLLGEQLVAARVAAHATDRAEPAGGADPGGNADPADGGDEAGSADRADSALPAAEQQTAADRAAGVLAGAAPATAAVAR